MAGKISKDLDRLSELRDQLGIVDTRIAATIPQSLRDQRNDLASEVSDLEAGIKKTAESLCTDHKKTFRGKLLQIVYTNSVSYPKAKILEHVPPRYLKLVAKPSTSWSIRKAAAE